MLEEHSDRNINNPNPSTVSHTQTVLDPDPIDDITLHDDGPAIAVGNGKYDAFGCSWRIASADSHNSGINRAEAGAGIHARRLFYTQCGEAHLLCPPDDCRHRRWRCLTRAIFAPCLCKRHECCQRRQGDRMQYPYQPTITARATTTARRQIASGRSDSAAERLLTGSLRLPRTAQC